MLYAAASLEWTLCSWRSRKRRHHRSPLRKSRTTEHACRCHDGTGIKGAEAGRLAQTTGPRIRQRVYFYLPVEGGIPQPE